MWVAWLAGVLGGVLGLLVVCRLACWGVGCGFTTVRFTFSLGSTWPVLQNPLPTGCGLIIAIMTSIWSGARSAQVVSASRVSLLWRAGVLACPWLTSARPQHVVYRAMLEAPSSGGQRSRLGVVIGVCSSFPGGLSPALPVPGVACPALGAQRPLSGLCGTKEVS